MNETGAVDPTAGESAPLIRGAQKGTCGLERLDLEGITKSTLARLNLPHLEPSGVAVCGCNRRPASSA
jgi:hypothetical protein